MPDTIEELIELIDTWETNHRLLLRRTEQVRQLCLIRARYLDWALDELRALRDLLPDAKSQTSERMLQAAQAAIDASVTSSFVPDEAPH
jgi:hypothetical protein